MIKAVIFDFDGVIADTEELHFNCLRRILYEEGITIDHQEYNEIYLALDDKSCFKKAFTIAKSENLSPEKLDKLVNRKAKLFQSNLEKVKLFTGIPEWIRKNSSKVLLGIYSGALRQEIDSILYKYSLLNHFTTIITTEEVRNGKPSPEGYILALQRLQEKEDNYISPLGCLVIEDSVAGIEAAKAASMYCVAITNSTSREKLYQADLILDTITELSIENISTGFK
ncbi:MAG: HAD family hydrolase [Acidobacteriota bacterium]